jgi:decaprenylphospho-beta-D-erythro-pentofuranosid-2-ulose 2-reductase
MSKHCLILGAKSDIARAIAHVYARNGWSLSLAGRGAAAELAADVSDLKIRYGCQATAVELDITHFEGHAAFYQSLSPKPDLVICVIGYMPAQADVQANPALARTVIDANFTGCAVLLDIAAADMEARKAGGIIGISSVAGDRGRATNYWYGSAKAGFTAYLSGLRNRLHKSGVHVLTVKPGFVYTKMTQGLPLPAPLTAQPDDVAQAVYRAFTRKKNILYTKWMWRWIMAIIRNIPEWQFKKMKL